MPKKPKSPTFAELVEEASKHPQDSAGPRAVRPGNFNYAGEFFDLDGNPLALVDADATPEDAQGFVGRGGLVAYEGCGCGGGGGCKPDWVSVEELSRLQTGSKPRFVKGYGSPTWIDIWKSDAVYVVFAHGDVEWGDVIP